MSSHPDAPPINPLPPAVVALALAIFAVEVLLALGARGLIGGPEAVGWRLEAARAFGFSPPLLAWMFETGTIRPDGLWRFFTYPFIHLGFTHVLMVEVFLLALGKLVGETLGNVAVIITFFASAAFGALVYAGLSGSEMVLVGGYPAVYGLIGSYTFLRWIHATATGQGQMRAFSLIGALLAIQLVFGVLFGTRPDWIADLAGFAMGFLIAPAVAPGGFRRMIARLRQR